MNILRRFWRQASTHYRNFQALCAVMTVAALGFAGFWAFTPRTLFDGFVGWNATIGGGAVPISDALLEVWRYVGAGYALAVAFGVRWVMRDLRNRHTSLVPVVALVGAPAALEFVAAATHGSLAPGLFTAGFLHLLVSGGFAVFGSLASSDIRGRADGALIPRPPGATNLGWTHFEERWLQSVLEATLPPRPTDDQPGFGEVELGDFWERYAEKVPLHFRLGLRAATWAVTLWPIVTFRSFRTFHHLPPEERDDVLQSIEENRFFIVRQITFVLKTTVGFGYFRSSEVQAQFPSAYDLRDEFSEES